MSRARDRQYGSGSVHRPGGGGVGLLEGPSGGGSHELGRERRAEADLACCGIWRWVLSAGGYRKTTFSSCFLLRTELIDWTSCCRWCNIKPLPGANRLIKHLRSNGVPTALASNSPRSNIEAKISCHEGWKESFFAIVGGDEVEKAKPSPDIFLEAAKRMNTDPSNCLVIEDSLPGVTAGKAAGMHVIAVPSVPKKTAEFSSADEVINSLLDIRLEKWGLPPFDDWIEGTLPIEPWFISGPVIKGFGRGSKILGIPTANLPAESFSDLASEHTSGVYFGWAGLSARGIYKMVMSIGWNPYFDNTEKTVEPWLLNDFGEFFYGEELRLAIVGYIRPEVICVKQHYWQNLFLSIGIGICVSRLLMLLSI
ncbi:hypothetical protein PR202_ga00433 [Eleusine coracana subsp. coracana]|uniref:riboflavin kinase n=1 Tax=Eleusine coracana subsp. coracana TaxID=191504 RepID=A0AAV5BD43_ELECO|nr:hypothetical protein PR202_ga00433 [Eleusine coracana subsp. coracana]